MLSRPFIQLRNISYRYALASAPILQSLDLEVMDERIGLIGPNGSGKTTLFQIIVGLLSPESGQVLFDGREMRSEKDFRILRRQVGFLFQHADDQLFSPTVLEDVAFGPLNLGCSAEEAKDIAIGTLKDLGLAGFEERITHRLSGGEKKLVALATILSMKPRLLLLDEPTNNLDPATRARLTDILQSLQQAHIIISHDWDFLAKTTSHLYSLEHGHLHRCDHDHMHSHQHIHPYGDHPHQHSD
ncbi:MAG: ATP-binding cassette domain-containing protein [Pseudomonadota bacterium]